MKHQDFAMNSARVSPASHFADDVGDRGLKCNMKIDEGTDPRHADEYR
jgi:hypothetical protein